MNKPEVRNEKEILSPLRRGAEVFFVICMLLLFGFFIYHQTANTGFFTAKFGGLEMVCLYGPLLFGITAPTVRAWTGEHNPARPFEAATSLFLAVGSLWLLIVFPFNYTHLADPLPGVIRFALAWITDDIGKIFMILQVIIGPITALTTVWKYLSVRQRESESYLKQRTL